MKIWMWGVLLGGMLVPLSEAAAFFQKTDKAKEEKPEESPVQVVVQGAEASLADNLKAFLPSLRNLKCDSPRDRVDLFIESSADKLQEGAEAMGYYSPRFNMTPARQNNCWVLNIAVQPGDPVKVTEVDVKVTGDGSAMPEFRDITAKPPYQIGDVLVHQQYEDFKTSLSRTANNLGYFDAEYLTREIQVNPDTRQAAVHLHFDTGKRYRIGKLKVEQDVLDQKYLNRYLRVHSGDAYNVETLLKQQRILEGSEYYQEVQVSSHYQDAENGKVPVDIVAKRAKRYTYTGQLGYGTDTGFRVEGGMDAHWINRKGHKLSVKGKVGQKESSLETAYKVPLWKPEHEYTSLTAGWAKSDNDDIKSKGFKVGVDYNRRTKNDWQQKVFINYLDETTQVVGEPENKAELTLLGVHADKTKRDDVLFPTKGWRFAADVQGAVKGALSDQSLLQAKAQGKYLHTLDNHGKVIVQSSAGTILTNTFDQVPKSLRFFAGGQNSVRGYDFESIGSTNAAGEVIGGKHLLTTSVEYEHPLADKWSAAAFVDAGDAFENKLDMKVGGGVGVRWQTPLGPVRADIASPKNNLSDVHFYFSLGPDL